MIAHYHGQIWNAAELARSLGTGDTTTRRYLDILSEAYLVRVLPPWFENLSKRQIKSPKVYVRDSGILHALLELESGDDLLSHPKLGSSWECFALEQVLTTFPRREAYFWATHSGAELDLMITIRGKRYGQDNPTGGKIASPAEINIATSTKKANIRIQNPPNLVARLSHNLIVYSFRISF